MILLQIHYFTILKLLLYFFLIQPYNHSWPLLNNYVQTWNRFKLLTDVKKSGVWNTCKRVSLGHGGTQIALLEVQSHVEIISSRATNPTYSHLIY